MSGVQSVSLACGELTASVALRGAELKSLQYAGTEFIWQADPVWWPFSAPLLFPVIGRLSNGRIDHEGRPLRLPPHGFARDLPFKLLEARRDRVELCLRATPTTLEMYPFDFELSVSYALLEKSIRQEVRDSNRGATAMPASFGFHPGFNWPVRQSRRSAHTVCLTHSESAGAFRVDSAGRLVARDNPMGRHGSSLALDDPLFADGAIVLDPLRSTGLEYRDEDGLLLRLDWTGCRQLGLWSLPGAPFVCFEPWHGHPSPAAFSGALHEKPGNFQLQPGESKSFGLAIGV